MALARLALKNLHQRLLASPSSSSARSAVGGLQRFSAEASDNKMSAGGETSVSEGKKVAVSEGGKKSKQLFPRRQSKKWLRRNNDPNFVPALYEFFPSGLGNALMQATENINRLFENLKVTPWSLTGQVKEKDECYKLRFEVPGLSKEEVKVTVDDGVLTIKGEHKEEKEEGSDDEFWSTSSYGYYNTSLVLPDDAKVDEIKAELKDGVLCITIPRTEKPKKEVQEVKVD